MNAHPRFTDDALSVLTDPDYAPMLPYIRKADPRLLQDQSELPDVYALPAVGDCMEPLIPRGSKLWFSKLERPAPGDIVIEWVRPEGYSAGAQCRVKRLLATSDEGYLLEALNPHQRAAFRWESIFALHKCTSISQPLAAQLTPN